VRTRSILTGAAVVATALVTAGSAPVAGAPSMSLELTVGEFDGVNSCTGTGESLTVPLGTQVEYCYRMVNTGDHTLTAHHLDSDVFGSILSDVDIDLEPGEAIVGSHIETLTGTHTSTGTWTATVVQSGEPGLATDSVTVTALPIDPDLGVAAESAAMSVDMTVMVDDGSDTCGTDTAAIVEKGTELRFCYTLTNTGDEALNLHDVRDSHIGQIAGPGFDHLVQPGDGVALTATGAFGKSALHDVTWEATGVESDTVVYEYDGVFVTVLGPEITLAMTVMIDDGHDTCGTETGISVAAGTQVRYCYTMTDSGDEDVNYHYLDDDQLGSLLDGLDREVEPGATLVHTEVAVITEAVTNTAQWTALSQGTGTDVWAVDSVTVEIGDDAEATTTTTSTVPIPEPCVPATPAPVTPPPTTSPPVTSTSTTTSATTTSTTTSTTATTTTTTTTPSVTTTTTGLGIVLPTTTTTLGEPAGFARRARSGAPCPDVPAPGGGTLPATGAPTPTQAAVASGLVAFGALLLMRVKRRRT
jgi:LPXTG-motif cell wall-anchored protein